MRKTHELNIYPEWFNAHVSGNLTFELIKNDRNFKVGDLIILRETNFGKLSDLEVDYTGRTFSVLITYILGQGCDGFDGLCDDYVIIGTKGLISTCNDGAIMTGP